MLQPRVTPSLPTGREGSLFQRVFSGPSGMDPYAFAVSDVYQDLFGEGSYCRQGDLRRRCLRSARSQGGFRRTRCSATIFWRGYSPARGWCPTSRSSRSFPPATTSPRRASIGGRAATGSCCPGYSVAGRGARDDAERSAIPLIGRWKMIDNLRRSLSAPAVLLALLRGWLLPFRVARDLERVRLCHDRDSTAASCHRRHPAAAGRASRCAIICRSVGSDLGSRFCRSRSSSRSSRIRPG